MIDDAAAKTAIGELDGGIIEGLAIKVTEAKPRQKRSNSDRHPSWQQKLPKLLLILFHTRN